MAGEQFQEVDESESALTGAFTGAAAGAVAGPIGALAGGIIGAGIGIFSANSQKDAVKKAKRNRDEALYKASVLKDAARRQSEGLRSTGKDLGPSKPGGGSATPSAIPTGATPTSSIGRGISSSSGTF